MAGNVDKITFISPCVREFRRKGFREFFLLEDTWGSAVFLLINPTDAQYKAWLKERFNMDETPELHGKAGVTGKVDFGGTIYNIIVLHYRWAWKREDWRTLVHELMHVTTNILTDRGLKHTVETDEAWAYLQASLLDRFVYAIANRRAVLERPKRALAKKRASK